MEWNERRFYNQLEGAGTVGKCDLTTKLAWLLWLCRPTIFIAGKDGLPEEVLHKTLDVYTVSITDFDSEV